MNTSGDAAEQVVRISLEGFEVAAKLTGSAAKNIAILLMAALKEEGKTKGKARLTSMIRSGKELKVFALPQKDLKKFTQEAKKYGVLYTVLRDKYSKDENAPVDIIARAEDASKIERIVERFELGKVDKAAIVADAQKNVHERESQERITPEKSLGERIVEEAMGGPVHGDKQEHAHPTAAKTDKNPPSRQNSEKETVRADKGGKAGQPDKPSVREKLERYKAAKTEKEAERREPEREKETKSKPVNRETKHKQPNRNKKTKTKSKVR